MLNCRSRTATATINSLPVVNVLDNIRFTPNKIGSLHFVYCTAHYVTNWYYDMRLNIGQTQFIWWELKVSTYLQLIFEISILWSRFGLDSYDFWSNRSKVSQKHINSIQSSLFYLCWFMYCSCLQNKLEKNQFDIEIDIDQVSWDIWNYKH